MLKSNALFRIRQRRQDIMTHRWRSQCRVTCAEINQQAAFSTIDVASLQAAFGNVFRYHGHLSCPGNRFDGADCDRAQGQIERAKLYLARTRQGEISG